jgi:hypothetical protein
MFEVSKFARGVPHEGAHASPESGRTGPSPEDPDESFRDYAVRALYNHTTTELTLCHVGETLDGKRDAVGTFDGPRIYTPPGFRYLPEGLMRKGQLSEARSARPSFVVASENCPLSTPPAAQRSFEDLARRPVPVKFDKS